MDCKKMEEIILTDYMDGKITGAMLKDVEAHLASCSRCRALYTELAPIGAEIRKAKRMEPPDRVWEKIRAEVSMAPGKAWALSPDKFFESVRMMIAHLKAAIVVATAAALILAVLTVAHLMPQRGAIDQEEIISLITMDENGNGTNYDFGTPEEAYFL